ncbi:MULTISPECIES: hypothetical protein [Sorangium]|uniref:Uncharacterized protein n=1 Tax=Sorangium cellulosum TaxID=56 RepID=A0A4P2QZD1_SORCE|nr:MULTISPECIES: hypothetical protein [Sorangium]AUX35676.1 uncharacterized protein SOCE836_078730 [Sorangium cellulosum]WCQ94977.1 hypothetical protein NQZ70_07751 [Sorangium sp. Soce836]
MAASEIGEASRVTQSQGSPTEAHDVLAVLEARRLEVPADVRERILVSTDLAELDRWLRKAAVVIDARELLATNGS